MAEIKIDLLKIDIGQGREQGQALVRGQGHGQSRMGKGEEENIQVILHGFNPVTIKMVLYDT